MALVLREEDVRILLSMPDTVAILEQVFGALADKNAINLPRQRIRLLNGVLHVLSAAAPTLGVLGYKSYTAFTNAHRGDQWLGYQIPSATRCHHRWSNWFW